MTEEEIQKLEDEFANNAGKAFQQAYEQFLKSGQTGIFVKNGFLIKQHPDGTIERIKEMPSFPVQTDSPRTLSF